MTLIKRTGKEKLIMLKPKFHSFMNSLIIKHENVDLSKMLASIFSFSKGTHKITTSSQSALEV